MNTVGRIAHQSVDKGGAGERTDHEQPPALAKDERQLGSSHAPAAVVDHADLDPLALKYLFQVLTGRPRPHLVVDDDVAAGSTGQAHRDLARREQLVVERKQKPIDARVVESEQRYAGQGRGE